MHEGRRAAIWAACAALSAILALFLGGCKPTDFFTEVIITSWAEEVDEDNPNATVVNSPDAEEESGDLSVLFDWSEDSRKGVEVEKLVTYSKDPNTDLAARHSIFDLAPLFAGIEASDGVRLTYDAGAETDRDVDAAEQDEQTLSAQSTGVGGSGAAESSQPDAAQPDDRADAQSVGDRSPDASPDAVAGRRASGGSAANDAAAGGSAENPSGTPAGGGAGSGSAPADGGAADADSNSAGGTGAFDYDLPSRTGSPDADHPGSAGESGSGDNPGSDPGGDAPDPGNTGTGDAPDTDKPGGGDTPDPYAGYGGTVPYYDPGNAFSKVQRTDRIAVLGTDALVLAQAIGGKGSVCATSSDAWMGLDADGNRATASYYGELFAHEGSGDVKVLWSGDGSRAGDLVDVEALVEACGQGGVIVYDQRLGDQTTMFTDDQRRELYAAGIQMAPVELSTVQGILDGARVIGDALSESEVCADNGHDAKQYAQDYLAFVDDMVRALAATHGGALAANSFADTWGSSDTSADSHLFGTLYNGCPVSTFHAAEAWAYIATDSERGMSYSGASVDASGIVLFRHDEDSWSSSPLLFWEQVAGVWEGSCTYRPQANRSVLFWALLGAPGGDGLSGPAGGAWSDWLGSPDPWESVMYYVPFNGNGNWSNWGLGSMRVPYLVVCGSSDGSPAADVKQATVESIYSWADGAAVTPYAALPYSAQGTPAEPGGASLAGTVGSQGTRLGEESPFLRNSEPLNAYDVVRENPCGLVGSWTSGSMESVLESVWLAELYSKAPANSEYAPVVDMSRYSVAVGGTTCGNAQETVQAFYEHFYRLPAESYNYSAIVTDGFEGLVG